MSLCVCAWITKREDTVELWVHLSLISAPLVHISHSPVIELVAGLVFIKLMLVVYTRLMLQLSSPPFCTSPDTRSHFLCVRMTHSLDWFRSCCFVFFCHATFNILCFSILLLPHLCRALSSLNRRVTSTWPSTTSRCCTMASWPAPSPSPTTPRRRMLSSAWSRRLGKTPPSSSTLHMPSCYRSVRLDSPCGCNHWHSEMQRSGSSESPVWVIDVTRQLSMIIALIFRPTLTCHSCFCEKSIIIRQPRVL